MILVWETPKGVIELGQKRCMPIPGDSSGVREVFVPKTIREIINLKIILKLKKNFKTTHNNCHTLFKVFSTTCCETVPHAQPIP